MDAVRKCGRIYSTVRDYVPNRWTCGASQNGGTWLPQDDGPSRRNHGDSPPPHTTISPGRNRGWGPSGILRYVHEAGGPALACVKKKEEIDPSLSALRGKRAPLIGAGMPATPRCPGMTQSWLIATAPEDPLPGPTLGIGPPISGAFTAPPRGPGATRIRGKRMAPYPMLGAGKRASRRGGNWPRFHVKGSER